MADTHSPAEVAEAIAEGMRTLNYLTGAGGSIELESPADLYDVLGSLGVAANRLPQLFDQMARWITAEHAAERVGQDQGADASEYVSAVADALQRASTDAVTLAAALDSAHEAASTLTAREDRGV